MPTNSSIFSTTYWGVVELPPRVSRIQTGRIKKRSIPPPSLSLSLSLFLSLSPSLSFFLSFFLSFHLSSFSFSPSPVHANEHEKGQQSPGYHDIVTRPGHGVAILSGGRYCS